MTIQFNGKEKSCREGESIAAFFRAEGIGSSNLILELNGEILAPDADLEEIVLKEGDRLNAFSLVGGG